MNERRKETVKIKELFVVVEISTFCSQMEENALSLSNDALECLQADLKAGLKMFNHQISGAFSLFSHNPVILSTLLASRSTLNYDMICMLRICYGLSYRFGDTNAT